MIHVNSSPTGLKKDMGTLKRILTQPLIHVPTLFRIPELCERLLFDIHYFIACDFLDGRQAPNQRKPSRFRLRESPCLNT